MYSSQSDITFVWPIKYKICLPWGNRGSLFFLDFFLDFFFRFILLVSIGCAQSPLSYAVPSDFVPRGITQPKNWAGDTIM